MCPCCPAHSCQPLPSTGVTLLQRYYKLIRLPIRHLRYLTVYRLDIAYSCSYREIKESILGLPSSHSLRLIPCYGLRPRWTHITSQCPRTLCYIPRPEDWTNGGVNAAFRHTDNVGFQNHQNFGAYNLHLSIVAWYPIPPASHSLLPDCVRGSVLRWWLTFPQAGFSPAGEYEFISARLC